MIDDETVKNLENLHRLKTEGIITDSDFEKAKENLLHGPPRRTAPTAFRHAAATATIDPPPADDHVGWTILPLKKYADFNGRSSRKEYWMYQLLYVVITIVMIVIFAADMQYGEPGLVGRFAAVCWLLAILGMFVPLIAVQVRRFHDQDKSGWFALFNLIPYLGPLIVLVFMMIEGTRGENQYGPDPLDT